MSAKALNVCLAGALVVLGGVLCILHWIYPANDMIGALSVIGLLAPALLAALVVTQTLGSGRHLQIDARLLGVAVAGIALWRKAPVLVVIVAAAAATAIVRLLV